MATWISDQINTIYSGYLGGTATAGVAGGPVMVRATEVRGITKVHRFTVEADYPNPLPDSPVVAGTSFVAGDTIVLAWMDPTERIYYGQVWPTSAVGAGTISFGKIDTNYPANTDPAHYLAATALVVGTPVNFNLNMTEQVGADPRGDQTYGNWIPAFGSGKIWLTATVGAALTAGGQITGFVLCVEEGN
jgi:hypothetical protein